MIQFIAASTGTWRVQELKAITGEPLPATSHLQVLESTAILKNNGVWTLRGFSSNVRYALKEEKEKLIAKQQGLGRPETTCAALIPIRKNEAWWNLAQDERRAIFEEQSHHTEIGSTYLPAIARKLYHCRDIGEPFDFLTWFEYAPQHAEAFEELVIALRRTEEWRYVEREVDIRLRKIV
jgi:chlorite dismutase